MKNRVCSLLLGFAALLACTPVVRLEVTTRTINPCYLGNGVEWDPYDEALSWGSEVSAADWDTLYSRLDFMKPQYVRCMINSPYTYYDNGRYDHDRYSDSIRRLLEYCQSRNVMVIYGEYNPPTWEKKGDEDWVEASVAHLNWLVQDLGFDCIKHFVVFNEPDGNWASTNGDYDFWKQMVGRFQTQMDKYPGLSEKVKITGPDAVIDYRNPASGFDYKGWLANTVKELPDIGIYDMHAYPGQQYVRSGRFQQTLEELKAMTDKPIILGESGYKYFSDPADSLLAREYWKRVEGHPYTKGSDCNMLVYDDFYALDMPILLMSVMNSGFSGAAAWMLDDAMHTNWDSGKAEDVKIWGMWNILGDEVFAKPEEENVRPWYWTWSLMCRNFPAGSEILRTNSSEGIAMVAARMAGHKYSVAMVNFSGADKNVSVSLPEYVSGTVTMFRHELMDMGVKSGKSIKMILPSDSFTIFTEN